MRLRPVLRALAQERETPRERLFESRRGTIADETFTVYRLEAK